MIKEIYRLLKNQPDTWPEQWQSWFAQLPRPSLASFVAKVEHVLCKRSRSLDDHIDTDTLPKRMYLVLAEMDNKQRLNGNDVDDTNAFDEAIDKAPNDVDAGGRLTPSNSSPETSCNTDLAIATTSKTITNNQANAMQVDCSLDDAITFGSDFISPQSVMEDISQRQHQLVYQPHSEQAFFPQTYDTHTTLKQLPYSPQTAHTCRRIAEKRSEVEAGEEEQWNADFDILCESQKLLGKKVLSQPNVYARPQLRSWINEQRSQHNRKLKGMPNNMTDDREMKLNSAGFQLPWSSRELASKALAEESIKRADEYCRVTVECTPRNFVHMCKRLGKFQLACMEGQRNPMDPELQAWIANMKEKQENKREGKSCELSDAMEYSLFRLGISPLLSQEVQAKIVDGSIHQERISLFVDNGGFKTWEKWRFMFDELAAFKDSQGNFIVLQRKNPTLYSWVYRQRTKYRETRLLQEEFDLLHSIGFTWY